MNRFPLVFACLLASPWIETTFAAGEIRSNRDWSHYLGGPDRSHYSPLTQITPANVAQLKVAWEYHCGEAGQMQMNPLVVGRVLYGVTPSGNLFALDADTGKERWRYGDEKGTGRILRGLAYWRDGEDERILFTRDSWLHAIDARSGKPVTSFGENGRTSLRAGLGETARDKYVVSTTPGTVFENLIIMPIRVEETEDAARGDLQAFDIRTGKLVWVFHTIPRPGEFGYDTWPPEAHRNFNVGGANCWAGMTLDVERGLLFVPLGSAGPDFWGGNRKGANLFSNCLVALDAATGQRKWHFQFVHHDIWDRDPPAPPNLVTLRRNGREIAAVSQTTKQGYVFVFDRVTGEPLFPIDEVPVPKSELPGEESWPTQPIPRQPAPYSRQTLTEADLNPYSAESEVLRSVFRSSRTGRFLPFSLGSTLIFPGFDGGAEWGGAAVDPDGILYVNESSMAWVARLVETAKSPEFAHYTPGRRIYATYCIGCHGAERLGNPASGVPSLREIASKRTREDIGLQIEKGRGMMPAFEWIKGADRQALIDYLVGTEKTEGRSPDAKPAAEGPDKKTPYRLDGYVKFLDRDGFPGVSPPWGTLNAIDLNTGEYRWKVLLGEYKELTAKGIPPTGAENYGGPVITAGGVLFIAATRDGMFRAFDKATGKLLWETQLPAASFATPATYEVDGRQYIVLSCGGTKLQTPSGDSYVAFALP